MARTTRTTESREEVRESIREFAKQMSPAPTVSQAVTIDLDPETARLFALVRAAK